MPRRKQTEAQIIAMQNHILDAAISLLEKIQPEEISIRKIAEKAGLSHMAIYTYFPSRDALVQALIARQEGQVRNRFDELLMSGEDGDFALNLKHALQDYIEKSKTRPKLFRLLWILPIRRIHTPANKKILLDDQINTLVELIEKGQQKGFFQKKDPQLAAMTLLCIINAPLFLFHMGRLKDAKMRDRIIDETLDLAINYITAKSN